MSIICGTDLSPASAGALDVAVALAKLRGDKDVVLVHVATDDTDEATLDKIRHELAVAATAAAGKATIGVRSELIVGEPEEALVQFAETETSDLIVIATRSSRSEGGVGTTAGRLVAQSSIPVIAVRDPGPWLAYANKERPLKLLIAIDDSAVCDLGIQWVHRMRTLAPIEIVLGAIYYPDDASEHYGVDRKSMVDRDPEIERVMARDLLRRFGGDVTGVVAMPRRGLGRIGDHVVELAREAAVDAIVIGTNQKTGIGKLGSVSSVVVSDATQSVVCVPPNANIATMTIPVLRSALVATDLSQFSNRAIPYAFAACEPDAEIHIVHIVDEESDVDVTQIERTLLSLVPLGAKQKVVAHVVRGDDAAKTVAQTAARLGVDLIAICSHGRSGITRALVGSVADRLLRATRLPVLVLRPA